MYSWNPVMSERTKQSMAVLEEVIFTARMLLSAFPVSHGCRCLAGFTQILKSPREEE